MLDLEDLEASISGQGAQLDSQEACGQSISEESNEVFHAIQASINRLFDISMAIRKPMQGDILRGSLQESVGYYDHIDRQHVRDKFRDAEPLIQDRLAATITQRRKELKYFERRRKKLGHGMDIDETDPSDRASTAPSDLIAHDFHVPDDIAMSESSYTSSFPESLWSSDRHTRMPPRPPELEDGRSGECPFCYRIIMVKSDRSWGRHVLVDLKTYICLVNDCLTPYRRYVHRRDWIGHVQ